MYSLSIARARSLQPVSLGQNQCLQGQAPAGGSGENPALPVPAPGAPLLTLAACSHFVIEVSSAASCFGPHIAFFLCHQSSLGPLLIGTTQAIPDTFPSQYPQQSHLQSPFCHRSNSQSWRDSDLHILGGTGQSTPFGIKCLFYGKPPFREVASA